MYLSDCIEIAERYAGLSSSDLIAKVKESYKTWDNYAIGILFLKLIRHIYPETRTYSKEMPKDSYSSLTLHSKIRILKVLENVFLANIDADPSKRMSLQETRDQIQKVLNMLEGQPTRSKIDKEALTTMKNDTMRLNTFIPRKN